MSNVNVIMCRQASDSLVPDHERGYFCRSCGKELQVSPRGRAQIAAGGKPFCNDCGLALARHHGAAGITVNPAARKAMGLGEGPPTDGTLYQQPSLTIERLPSGKVDCFDTMQAGGVPDRPQWMVCDCCLRQSDRLWLFAHYGFCIRSGIGPRRMEFLAGHWAFCVFCEPLRSDLKLLVARVVSLNPHLDPIGIERTYEVMLQCLYGERTQWKSGERIVRPPEAEL